MRKNQIHTKIGIMDDMASKIYWEGAISGDFNGFYYLQLFLQFSYLSTKQSYHSS